jgi:hypothetical protein
MLLGLDIVMKQEVLIMNQTYIDEFCTTDALLVSWCNYTETNGFTYCVVSDKWPQEDIGNSII